MRKVIEHNAHAIHNELDSVKDRAAISRSDLAQRSREAQDASLQELLQRWKPRTAG
jgi:hypothetical protein